MLLHASRASLCLLLWLLTACGANLAPVLEVQNAPVVTPQGVTATRAHVRDAIVRALVSRTWQVTSETDGAIEATVSAGGHSASVLVQYDERSFSITRVSSTPGLKYDGTRIHRRYNHWIDRLRASINQELSTTGAAPAAPAPPAQPAAPAIATGEEEVPAPPPPPSPPPAPPPAAGATTH